MVAYLFKFGIFFQALQHLVGMPAQAERRKSSSSSSSSFQVFAFVFTSSAAASNGASSSSSFVFFLWKKEKEKEEKQTFLLLLAQGVNWPKARMERRRKWEEFTKHCPSTLLESNLQKGQECGKFSVGHTFFVIPAVCETRNISIACVTEN